MGALAWGRFINAVDVRVSTISNYPAYRTRGSLISFIIISFSFTISIFVPSALAELILKLPEPLLCIVHFLYFTVSIPNQ